jgi:predicted transposase/invertase (TIGR01784 family)
LDNNSYKGEDLKRRYFHLRRRVFDETWKQLIENHLPEFLEFYFPDIAAQIDHSKGHTFLEQELAKIAPKSRSKRRRVDKLVQVYLKAGGELWVLLHLEVQTYNDEQFAERMFSYSYRIFDHYQRPVASLAVLADQSATFRPKSFDMELLGHKFVHFEFVIVKLLDWQDKEEELRQDPRIFAIVTLASLKAYERKFMHRYQWKKLLIEMLYERGYSEQAIRDLYQFLDGILVLPEKLEIRYNEEITRLEEGKKMPYVTSAERIGIKKGKQEGLQLGKQEGLQLGKQEGLQLGKQEGLQGSIVSALQVRFGKVPGDLSERVRQITDMHRLESLFSKAILAASVEEFCKEL